MIPLASHARLPVGIIPLPALRLTAFSALLLSGLSRVGLSLLSLFLRTDGRASN
jgi:hypothetical protein